MMSYLDLNKEKKIEEILKTLNNKNLSGTSFCGFSIVEPSKNKKYNPKKSYNVQVIYNSVYGKTNISKCIDINKYNNANDIFNDLKKVLFNKYESYEVTFTSKINNMMFEKIKNKLNEPQFNISFPITGLKNFNVDFINQIRDIKNIQNWLIKIPKLKGTVVKANYIDIQVKKLNFRYFINTGKIFLINEDIITSIIKYISNSYVDMCLFIDLYPNDNIIFTIKPTEIQIDFEVNFKDFHNKFLFKQNSEDSAFHILKALAICSKKRNEIIKIFKEIIEEKENTLKEEIRYNDNVYKNIIAINIIELLKNNKKELSRAALIKNISDNLNKHFYINKIDFNISILASETALVQLDIIKYQTVFKKGKAHIGLCLNNDNVKFFEESLFDPLPDSSFLNFKDYDWIVYISSKKANEYMYKSSMLKIFDRTELICMKPELIRKFLIHAPQEWKEYIGTLYEIDEEKKEYWSFVLSLFSKKNTASDI